MSIENMIRAYSALKDVIVSTYFLEVFLLSVRGENSAALMTLVLDDILRRLSLLFSSIPLFTDSFSSILNELLVMNFLTETNRMVLCGGKQLLAYKNPHTYVHKERRSMTTQSETRRKFEYGGLLEMDQSDEAPLRRHVVGGARDVYVTCGKDGR